MRVLAIAAISALALGACGQSGADGQSGAAEGAGGLFPNLFQGAYRAEATVTAEGQAIPVIMIRDGARQRIEFNSPQGQMVIVNNGDSGENFVLTSAGGRTIAMRSLGVDANLSDPAEAWSGEMGEGATRTGVCAGAGQTGVQWTHAESGDTACVTNDGIILSATENGHTVWETTSVQRGPQNPALFALPAGVQVMDLGNMMQGMDGAMADALARAKAGQGGR